MRAIVFPGQGAQHPGMALDFVRRSRAARQVFERASEAVGFDLEEVVREGPPERLAATDVCQPAILAASMAVVRALEEDWGLKREDFGATAGLSLGEYGALWFAGGIDMEDALRVVAIRGRAMQRASEARPSGMLALVGADRETAEAIAAECAGPDVLVVANVLGERNVALAGDLSAIERAEQAAGARGIRRTVRLDVAGAFHSLLMASATEALAEALAGVTIRAPRIRFFSNVTGGEVREPEEIRRLLARQVTAPVLWLDILRGLAALGVEELWEPAPGRVLTGLARKALRGVRLVNVERPEDVAASPLGEAREEGAS